MPFLSLRESGRLRMPTRGPGRTAAPPTPKHAPAPVDRNLASLLDPESFAAAQYRVLRHDLAQLRQSRGLRVVAVCSAGVGEGKTTTSINLAATLAEAPGARVLLVEADLRRPAIATRLALGDVGPGLVGAVVDPGLELAGLVRRRPPFTIEILPAGRCPDEPYDVLGSARFGEMLAEAREAYDFVVVDTPPLLLAPDWRALVQWVDGFVTVVAANRTPRRLFGEALNVLDPAKVLGIVLNFDDRPLFGYYKRYSPYYLERAKSHHWPGRSKDRAGEAELVRRPSARTP